MFVGFLRVKENNSFLEYYVKYVMNKSISINFVL